MQQVHFTLTLLAVGITSTKLATDSQRVDENLMAVGNDFKVIPAGIALTKVTTDS